MKRLTDQELLDAWHEAQRKYAEAHPDAWGYDLAFACRGVETAVMAPLQEMVAKQAKDGGLWFRAKTAPEAYLQQELRKLHRLIEGEAALEAE